jgi:Nucleotidyltransferase domain
VLKNIRGGLGMNLLSNADRIGLDTTLRKTGLNLSRLEKQAESILLFGSRAAKLHRADSDWDILCVGKGEKQRLGNVDLVWVDPHRVETQQWLGSELANHVASFGQHLSGDSSWTKAVFASQMSVEKKSARVANRLIKLHKVWNDFTLGYRNKYWRLLNQDISRLNCLYSGRAVPPTATLRVLSATELGNLFENVKEINKQIVLYDAIASTMQQTSIAD